MIFINWHFWPPEVKQGLNYEFTSQTRFAAHVSSRFSGRNVDQTRESGGNGTYVQPVETIKTESETANCCKISQYINDHVAALDGWQCEDVGCKVSWHENIKPLVPSVWYNRQPETRYGVCWSVCELFTKSWHCDMKLNENPITISKILLRLLK